MTGENKKRSRKANRSMLDRIIYTVLNNFFRLLWMIYLRFRTSGSNRYPAEGAALICSNHQSHLDPILVANSSTRYVSFVARESLFKNRFFGWLISALGAFPINRDAGLSGIKTTLKKLKQGDLVLIFPEGTRTPNGEIQPFKPGFCAIARRSKVPIVPVAIDGAYDAWPKSKKIPSPSKVRLLVGEPISIEEIEQLGDEELTERVQKEVISLQNELRFGKSQDDE